MCREIIIWVLAVFIVGFMTDGVFCQEGGRNLGAEGVARGGGFELSLDNGGISLMAQDAPLREVLLELGRLAGTEIDVGAEVSGRISDAFSGLPVDKAVERLVGSWAMVFEEDTQGYHRLVRCVVPHREEGERGGPARGGKSNPRQIPPRGARRLEGGTQVTSPAGTSEKPVVAPHIPGEVLVRFWDDVSKKAIDQVYDSGGFAWRRRNDLSGHYIFGLPERLSVKEAMGRLAGEDIVACVEPNYLMKTQDIPNDPEYPKQWALGNIRAPLAWDLDIGPVGAVIAVIDTGVDYTHPDLWENLWHNLAEIPGNGIDDDGNGFIDDDIGWDFVETTDDCSDADCGGRDRDPMDAQGHGTHVAGILGAVTNNNTGIAGVSPNARIMAVRAGYEEYDGGGVLEVDDAVSAIYYACDNGADILNLSWGGTGISSRDSEILASAVQWASEAGVLVCAAAGNEGSDEPFYPAAYEFPNVMAVGSTTQSGEKAPTSNYGDWVDVSAPGVQIWSTCVGGGYCYKSGTSMAAPHVAGLAALLFSRFPGWPVEVIIAQLLGSVRVEAGLQIQNATSGIIDCRDALELSDGDVTRFMEGLAASVGTGICGEETICQGDSDGDGDVDGADLADFAGKLLN
jgi:subtilisin family serine protease